MKQTRIDTGWKAALAAGLFSVGAAALLLVLLEAVLRISGYGYPANFFVRIEGAAAYTANQKYGWRFFPRAIARTPLPCYLPGVKQPRTYRIFVLGESAALGIPEPAFSFARILEAMLEGRFPATRFEVINTAMTAIDSHAILPIARDCARHSPDLFVIYMGNNEVVGPYGAGTPFGRYSPSLAAVRAGIWFRATRTGQLVWSAAGLVAGRREEAREWKGMAAFLEHLVPVDDPRLPEVYANFRANLADICRAATRAGSRVVLSTVATNLRNSPPFASVHRAGFLPAGKPRWDALYPAAVELERAGEFSRAAAAYQEAAKLDGGYAELHFRLARCLLSLGRTGEARKQYVLARDLDALRFRADTQVNRAIREVAASLEPQGVRLVDAERAFEQADGGIPGEKLFYEHVHANFAGNYVLAEAVFRQVTALLPAWVRPRDREVTAPPLSRAAELLCLTGWDQYKMAAEMSALTGQPPFTNQLEHAAAQARREALVAGLRARDGSPQALAEARAAYAAAVRQRPDDLALRLRFAQILRESGDHAGAADQWRALVGRVPGVAAWHASLGDALRDQGRLEEAAGQMETALGIDPALATAHFGLGAILDRQGRLEQAAASYSRALRFKPDYAEAHNNLGTVLARLGDSREAVKHYEEALRIKPDFAEAHNNLGVALSRLGQLPLAVEHYSAALRIRPEYAEAHYDLGGALAGLGHVKEAMAHYEEALRLRPDYAEPRDALATAHNNLGTALARRGAVGEAIVHLSRAIALRPDWAEAHFNLGVVLERAGRIDEAAARYAEALRLRPDFAPARNRLAGALARRAPPVRSTR